MNDSDRTSGLRSQPVGRRQLLKTLGIAGSVLALGGSRVWLDLVSIPTSSAETGNGAIPKRALGKTGLQVSALCFGGAHWGRIESEHEAVRILHEAIDSGVTVLDDYLKLHFRPAATFGRYRVLERAR